MEEGKNKGNLLTVVGGALAIVGVKGCAIMARAAESFGDDAARAAAHLAPAAEDAARTGGAALAHGSTELADDAGRAALTVGKHSSNLVDDGRKLVKPMSDSQRIVESAKNVARTQLRRHSRSTRRDDEDEKR
jgi:hypothetical protein